MAEILLRANSSLQDTGFGPTERGFEGNAPPITSSGTDQVQFRDALAVSGSHYQTGRQRRMGVPPQPHPVSRQFLVIHSSSRSTQAPVQALDSSDDGSTPAVDATSPANQDSCMRIGSMAALAMENQRLREEMICKRCRLRDVDAVLLPCGHLCWCRHCAEREKRRRGCSTCGRYIEDYQRIFFC